MRSRQSLFTKFRSTQIDSCSFELFHFYFISERFEILNTKIAGFVVVVVVVVVVFLFCFVLFFLFLAVSIKFTLGKKKKNS